MMPDTRPMPAADARAAVAEAKLARILERVQELIDLLETLGGDGPILDRLRKIVAEAQQ